MLWFHEYLFGVPVKAGSRNSMAPAAGWCWLLDLEFSVGQVYEGL